MLCAEVDANVEVPDAYRDPQKPLLDAGQRLSLPAAVEPEIAQTRRPSSTLEGEGVSHLADGRGPDERRRRVELSEAVETPNGTRAVTSDLDVMAKTCGGKCCEALVGPVVTVSQAGLLRMPGGGSKLGCWFAAAADIAVTRPTRTTRLATRSTIVEVTFVGPAQVPQETFPHPGPAERRPYPSGEHGQDRFFSESRGRPDRVRPRCRT
jgi:hypothetical protein